MSQAHLAHQPDKQVFNAARRAMAIQALEHEVTENDSSESRAIDLACSIFFGPYFQMLGHWLYDGTRKQFLFDNTCAELFALPDHHKWYAREDIVNALTAQAAERFWLNFQHSTLGNIIFERFEMQLGPLKGKYLVAQGSVLLRDKQGNALYATGYLSHESSPYSEFIPRELSGDGLYLWYPQTDEVVCCASFHTMLGYTEKEFPHTMTQYVRTIVHPDDNDVFIVQRKIAQSPQYGNYFETCQRLKHKDGHYLWMIGRGLVIERNDQGEALKIIGSRTNINLMQSNFDNIKLMMFTDSLTGLRNRNYFQQQAVRYIDPKIQPLSIIFVDVTGLKLTNDILGHSYGDYLLLKTCELINQAVSAQVLNTQGPKARTDIPMHQDLISDLNKSRQTKGGGDALHPDEDNITLGQAEILRLAGDEFLVLLPNCPLKHAQSIAARIQELRENNNRYHQQHSDIKMRPVPVFFGIGVATMGESKFEEAILRGERAPTGDDLRQVLDRADARMQAQKESQRDQNYRELQAYFEEKKGRKVSMRDGRRLQILTEDERAALRKRRVSHIVF